MNNFAKWFKRGNAYLPNNFIMFSGKFIYEYTKVWMMGFRFGLFAISSQQNWREKYVKCKALGDREDVRMRMEIEKEKGLWTDKRKNVVCAAWGGTDFLQPAVEDEKISSGPYCVLRAILNVYINTYSMFP